MRLKLAVLLALGLAGCNLIFPPDPPRVSVATISPAPGETDVALSSTVVAELELGDTALNLTTLTPETVSLSGPAGPVEANRAFQDGDIVLTPTAELAAQTTYTFSVTSGLKTEGGQAVEPYTSTLTTGDPETPEPLDPTIPGTGVDGLELRYTRNTPSSERTVLSRIGSLENNPCFEKDPPCTTDTWANLTTTDDVRVALENTGSEPLNLALSTSAPESFTVTPSSVTLEPGADEVVEIAFSGDFSAKGIYDELFHAEANDQRASLELVGNYLTRPEGGNEPNLPQILEATGYQVNLGDFRSNAAGSPEAGSEVRSRLWQRANPNQDIVVTQLAAYKTCCFTSQQGTTDFELFAADASGGSDYFFQLQYNQNYGQTIYPDGADTGIPNVGRTDTTIPFRIQIDRYSTKDPNETGLIGVRAWQITGQPNNYIVGQDYALSDCDAEPDPDEEDDPTGLVANCDFQDHVYLVTNIEPVASP